MQSVNPTHASSSSLGPPMIATNHHFPTPPSSPPFMKASSPIPNENTMPGLGKTTSAALPTEPASPDTPPPFKKSSRFEDLERKRLGLVKMRVSLEQKLFETKNFDNPSSAFFRKTNGGVNDLSQSGRGNYIWPDGKSVTGQWSMGQLNGRCFFQWPSGETYDGDCVNGKKHGRGVHTWPDGKVYKGQYQNGYEHGFGTLTQADGVCRYRGQFSLGKRHGLGTQIWLEKNYEGEWKDNALCGRGKLSWKNGSMYEGEFLQGRYHGQGVYTESTTGRKYGGSWVRGQKEGFGRETWPQTGEVYEGNYQRGRRNGFGRYTMGDGSHYVGGWCNGERAGCGIHVTSNGDVLHCGPLFPTPDTIEAVSSNWLFTQQQSPTSPRLLQSNDTNWWSSSPLLLCFHVHSHGPGEGGYRRVPFHDDMDLVPRRQIHYQPYLSERRYHDDDYLLFGCSNNATAHLFGL
ncbi:hypothetical protein ACA910_000716 [Epithemia clementina (nom. ined.)]